MGENANRPGPLRGGGSGWPAGSVDRWAAAAMLLIPAALAFAGLVLWPAPANPYACGSRTAAQVHWLQGLELATGAAAVLLAGAAAARRRRLVPWEGIVLAALVLVELVSGGAGLAYLIDAVAVAGLAGCIFVLGVGLTALGGPRGSRRLLSAALWVAMLLVLPTVFAGLALSDGLVSFCF